MNTKTNTATPPAPFIPAGLTFTVLSKWIDWHGHKETGYSGKPTGAFSPVFQFKLTIEKDGRSMDCDYSGGVLAFLPPSMKGKATTSPKHTTKPEVEALFKRATLDPENVIHSMIMDAQAGAETFSDFCGSCGYDEDSRKAFATWEACQKNGADFRRVLGSPALFAELETAFQDY